MELGSLQVCKAKVQVTHKSWEFVVDTSCIQLIKSTHAIRFSAGPFVETNLAPILLVVETNRAARVTRDMGIVFLYEYL